MIYGRKRRRTTAHPVLHFIGGASGIGKYLTEHLIANGFVSHRHSVHLPSSPVSTSAVVVCADINTNAGTAFVQELNNSAPAPIAHFLQLDVTKRDAVLDAFEQAHSMITKVDRTAKLDFVFPSAISNRLPRKALIVVWYLGTPVSPLVVSRINREESTFVDFHNLVGIAGHFTDDILCSCHPSTSTS